MKMLDGKFRVVCDNCNRKNVHIVFTQDGDLVIKLCDDISRCNGLALNNVTSDELITIATRGNYLIKAANDISGGNLVIQNGIPDAVSAAGITSTGSWQGLVGRALTNAGSEDYCLVSLNI